MRWAMINDNVYDASGFERCPPRRFIGSHVVTSLVAIDSDTNTQHATT